MRRPARAVAALAMGAAVVALAACSSSPRSAYPYPPATGTAVEVGQPVALPHLTSADRTGPSFPDAGTLGLPDGSILTCGLSEFLVSSLTPGPKPLPILDVMTQPKLPVDVAYPYGFARSADGHIYLGWDGILFVATSPALTDLKPLSSATPAAPRSGTDPVPATADAQSFRFSERMKPVGVRPDGSVVILDGEALWSYKDGRLTRLLQKSDIPASALGAGDRVDGLGGIAAVDPRGTVWLAPTIGGAGSDDEPHLADVVGLTTAGTFVPLSVPSAASTGLADPKTAWLTALTPDGDGGFYARVGLGWEGNQQVVHLHAGRIDVVAESTVPAQDETGPNTKNLSGAVDARHIPLFLPTGIVVRPGMLVLIGGANYALAVGIPAQ